MGGPSEPVEIPASQRKLVLERDGGCVVCGAAPYDVHHRKRRRSGGHAASNLVALCRLHHSQAHANPDVARAWGLIVPMGGDPSRTPLWSPLRGSWVLYDDEGGWTAVA